MGRTDWLCCGHEIYNLAGIHKETKMVLWNYCGVYVYFFAFVVGWRLCSMSWVVARVCVVLFVCKCQIVLSGNQTHIIYFHCQELCKVLFCFVLLNIFFFQNRSSTTLFALPESHASVSVLAGPPWLCFAKNNVCHFCQESDSTSFLQSCYLSFFATGREWWWISGVQCIDCVCGCHRKPAHSRSFRIKLQLGLDSNLSVHLLSVKIHKFFPLEIIIWLAWDCVCSTKIFIRDLVLVSLVSLRFRVGILVHYKDKQLFSATTFQNICHQKIVLHLKKVVLALHIRACWTQRICGAYNGKEGVKEEIFTLAVITGMSACIQNEYPQLEKF